MNAYDTTYATDDTLSNPVPHYVERYNLNSAPFSTHHEDRFVYLDAERLQRLNMLEHLTRYSELLLIISGVKGIGKTSLLQHFVLNTDEDTRISQVNANPMMDADKLVQAIASGFALKTQDTDPVSLQDALYHHLAQLHHQQKIPVLVIDDAHVLPQEALEALFNLAEAEASDGSLLRIILFSDPQIETMLQSPAIQGLRERVTHSMSLPAFDEEQTVGYIRHRLSTVGLQGALPFSDKELHRIYRNSGGIPTRINECAHLILNGDKLDQAVKDFHTPRLKLRPTLNLSALKFPSLRLPTALAKLKRWQLASALIMVLGVMLALGYQDAINAIFEAPTQPLQTRTQPLSPPVHTPQPIAEPVSAETALEPPVPAAVSPKPTAANTLDTTVEAITPITPKTEISNMAELPSTVEPERIAPPSPTPEPEPAPVSLPPTPIIRDISPDPVNTSRKPQTISILGEYFNQDMRVTVFWTGGKKTLSAQQIKIINANEMELHITVGRKPDTWKIRLNDPVSQQQIEAQFKVTSIKKTAAPTSPTTTQTIRKTTAVNNLHSETWIANQPPQYFTLQLLGSHNKDSLQRFIKKHTLQQDTASFSSLRNNRPWHVLIQGRYTSRAEAEKAASSTAETMRGIKPWIRPFADIQKTLKQQTVTPPPVSIGKPPSASDVATSAAWLWSQDPSHYSLQLLAGQSESSIQRFIRQHQLSAKAVYYRTRRNGQPWYVLVYNSYPSHATAKAAIATLPGTLRKTRPWPRSFASIHAELP